jgi:hypothetical protein
MPGFNEGMDGGGDSLAPCVHLQDSGVIVIEPDFDTCFFHGEPSSD